jgi:DNA-binding MarR family transcriptional regulator
MVFPLNERKTSFANNHLSVLIPEAGLPRENFLAIARVYALMTKRLDRALRTIHLTISQFEVLVILRAMEGLSQQEMAECLLVTKGNICTLLRRMEKNKWVIRQRDSKDGRARCLYLTPEGRQIVTKAAALTLNQEKLLMKSLSVQEQQSLHELLDHLEESLRINDTL